MVAAKQDPHPVPPVFADPCNPVYIALFGDEDCKGQHGGQVPPGTTIDPGGIGQQLQDATKAIGDQINQIRESIGSIPLTLEEATRNFGMALTPSTNDPWSSWRQAWDDFTSRWVNLFKPSESVQGHPQATGIGKLNLPELAIPLIIVAVGIGILDNWNPTYAFMLVILLLLGLFVLGGKSPTGQSAANYVSQSIDHLRQTLGYPATIPTIRG